MSENNFRLPPLDGDDIAVRMERDLLMKWGFLDSHKAQTNSETRSLHSNISVSPEVVDELPTNTSSVNEGGDDRPIIGDKTQSEGKGSNPIINSTSTEVAAPSVTLIDIENEKDDDRNGHDRERDSHENTDMIKSKEYSDEMKGHASPGDNLLGNLKEGKEINKTNEDSENAKGIVSTPEKAEHTSNSASDREQETMSESAKRLYDQAYTAYSKKKFCECLVFVDEALELSDVNCVVELWLLRAKVMNSMEDHRQALSSVYKVKVGDRPSRLWVEGALALEKLGLLATAENWVARAMQTCESSESAQGSGNDVMDILFMMRNRLRIERVFGPLIKDKPIRVTASLKYNRLVCATRTIEKSEIIFQELPEIMEQSIKSHRLTACAHCAKSLVQPQDVFNKEKGPNLDLRKATKKFWLSVPIVDCKTCKEVKYCGEECRKQNWESCHNVICPSNPESTASMLYDVRKSFRDVIAADGSSWQGWWNAEFSPTFLARMWATVLCRAKGLANLSDKESYSTSDWLMIESSLEKYSPTKKIIPANESIPKMHELLDSVFKRSKVLRFPITDEEFNKRYSQLTFNVVKFHDPVNPADVFVKEVRKDKKLTKKLSSHLKTFQAPLAEFHGLFPLVCCFNHSCFPNAELRSERVEGKPGLSVRAVMNIKPGEEIFVSYVEPGLERDERRSQLWKKYKIICQCLRCIHEGIGPDRCTNCRKTPNKSKCDTTSPKSEGSMANECEKDKNGHILHASGECADGNERGDKGISTGETSAKGNISHQDERQATSIDDVTTVRGTQDVDTSLSDVNGPSADEHAVQKSDKMESSSGEGTDKPTEGRENDKPKTKFAVCGRCKRAWYCSVQCQKEAWVSGHKKICVPP